jgi:uncharacterized protein YkwD
VRWPGRRSATRAALVFALAIVSLTAPEAGSAVAGDTGVAVALELGRAITAEINDVRASESLRRLSASAPLVRSSRHHALAMGRLGFFSHLSADGSGVSERITSFYWVRGARGWAVGEVILWRVGAVSAAETVSSWLASSTHRGQLLGGPWRELGVTAVRATRAAGVYGGRSVTIVVADFGVRRF